MRDERFATARNREQEQYLCPQNGSAFGSQVLIGHASNAERREDTGDARDRGFGVFATDEAQPIGGADVGRRPIVQVQTEQMQRSADQLHGAGRGQLSGDVARALVPTKVLLQTLRQQICARGITQNQGT
jgi:hypothetical protein